MSEELYGLPSDGHLSTKSNDTYLGIRGLSERCAYSRGAYYVRNNHAIPLLKTAHEKIEQLEKDCDLMETRMKREIANSELLAKKLEVALDALKKIKDEDFRGNRPQSAVTAYHAYNEIERMK